MSAKNKNSFLSLPFEIAALTVAAGGIFTSMAYPFFHFITYGGKKKEKTAETDSRYKRFQFQHTRVNHPRNEHEEEYTAVRTWCEQQDMKDVYIRSYDGLNLHGKLFPADNPRRIVLLSHGYKGTSFGAIAHMAKFMHENHTTLLFTDQRCCGESEGKYITFGAKEQLDVVAWVNKLHHLNESRLPIYLFGQSMGASTVLMASAHELPPEVKGIIADSGFHSMKQQMRDIAKHWFHFQWIGLLLLRLDFFCRLFAGFRMKDADTTEALEINTRPVLFFHGSKDTYVLPRNTELNYKLCRAPKEMVIIPGARHICSSYEAPELYREKLLEFFSNYDG
jgi:fermentation-respiration switch protein FrsA (DUF1100 family)